MGSRSTIRYCFGVKRALEVIIAFKDRRDAKTMLMTSIPGCLTDEISGMQT